MEEEEEAMLRKAMEMSRLEAEEQNTFSRLESKAAAKEKELRPEESKPPKKVELPPPAHEPTIVQSQAAEPIAAKV